MECLNPLESGHVSEFSYDDRTDSAKSVLIPLNRGMFLNLKTVLHFVLSTRLNPLEAGHVSESPGKVSTFIYSCLNPLESGHVSERGLVSESRYNVSLNPLESGHVSEVRRTCVTSAA